MKNIIALLFFSVLMIPQILISQVGIGTVTPDTSSILDIQSNDKGVLLPRLTTIERDAISAPANGLLIYNTTTSSFDFYSANWKFLSSNDSYGSIDMSGTISTSSTSDVLMSGMATSPEPVTYMVFFNSQYSIISPDIISTAQGARDLNVIYNEINTLPVTNSSHPIAIVTGEILTPGVYSFAGALSIAGVLTLDAQNNPDAVFVFKTLGAFNTGAGVDVALINGASASNVYWLAEGAIGLGAGTKMKGTLLSHGAAVAVGADSLIEGRMLSTAGAITFGPGTVSLPSGTSFINFRILKSFVMFTSAGGLGNTGVSQYNGDIGTGLGTLTGFETATITGTVFPPGESTEVANVNTAIFSLYQNGVLIPNSSRIRTSALNTVDVSLQAIATVAQGEDIDVRWKIDSGTLSVKNRILSIIKVQ